MYLNRRTAAQSAPAALKYRLRAVHLTVISHEFVMIALRSQRQWIQK